MNEIQRRIAAQLWNSGKDTMDIALAIFGTAKVMVSVFPLEYTNTEAIVCRNLRWIKNEAQKLRLKVAERA